jgi:hypothetical protein
MIQLPPRTRWNIRISNTASAGRLGSKPPCAQCRPSVATNKPLLRTATRSPGRGSSSLALPPVRASRQPPETLRHGRFAYLPRESLKRVRAARAMISPARREKPCISTVAGGVLGSKDNGCSQPCFSVGGASAYPSDELSPSEELR